MNYWWRIRAVRGERVRRIGWWLKTAPPGKTIKASSLRFRLGSFMTAITDDRAMTLRHQSRFVRLLRRRLGRAEREYELVEKEPDA